MSDYLHIFLTKLDTEVSKVGEKIILLRNYQSLPYRLEGDDLDIIVSNDKKKYWLTCLSKVANEFEMQPKILTNYRYCTKIHFYAKKECLKFDIVPCLWWRGVNWLSEQDVISQARLYKAPIWKPCSAHEFIITFNHSFLHGGFFPEKYANKLIRLYEQNPRDVQIFLERIYGPQDAQLVLKGTLNKDFQKLNNHNKAIRIRCLIRHFFRNPVALVVGFISSYIYDWYLNVRKRVE